MGARRWQRRVIGSVHGRRLRRARVLDVHWLLPVLFEALGVRGHLLHRIVCDLFQQRTVALALVMLVLMVVVVVAVVGLMMVEVQIWFVTIVFVH